LPPRKNSGIVDIFCLAHEHLAAFHTCAKEDDILQPVEKRPRVKEDPLPGMHQDNIDDVVRAACFFADEADFYKAELKRMKDNFANSR